MTDPRPRARRGASPRTTRATILLPVLLAVLQGICTSAARAAASVGAAASTAGSDPIAVPGTHEIDLEHGGQRRRALVHVPRRYDPARATPLLLAFHGGGGHMQLMAGPHYGLLDKAEQAGFVAVFPNGSSRFPGGRLATWNAGNCCGFARDNGVDDVGFVRTLVKHLQGRLTIDARRIFATGMSNGGMLAHRLGCEASDLVRAVAPVAGTDGTPGCTSPRPVSVLHIHARDDTHVSFEGGPGPDAVPDRRQIADFDAVPATMARWARRNRCSGLPEPVLQVPGARCEAWRDCADGALVQLCVTDRGGHSWPGGTRVRVRQAEPSQAISANDVMWEFFERVTKR